MPGKPSDDLRTHDRDVRFDAPGAVQCSEMSCGPPRAVPNRMRRLLGLITLLVPALGHAQPGAMDPLPPGSLPPESFTPPSAAPPAAQPFVPLTDPQVLALARGTHSAAARGDCVGARALGSQIARLDPEFHRTVIRTDPVITHCRPVARTPPVAQHDDERADAYEPARSGTPPVSGAMLAGEFLLGGLFTVGGAIGGAYLGASLDSDCSDECYGGIILGAFLGGTVMAAVGVNLVGDSGEADGSLGLAIGGAMLGGFLGIAAVADSNSDEGSLFVLIAAPTLGAMLGHNIHRTYKPQRARQPTIDRRMAILPSAPIGNTAAFTLTGGTF